MLCASATSCPARATGNDRAALVPVPADASFEQAGACRVLIVADGAQGQGGARAADIAVAFVTAHAPELARERTGSACEHALSEIDRRIVESNCGGLTTAVLVVVYGDGLVGASVGDSEAQLIRAHEVVDLTEQQSRRPLLGSGAAKPVGFGPTSLDGRLLVATDGLFKYGALAQREQIARTAPLADVAFRLVESVRLRNGQLHDDVTVYVLEPLAALGFEARPASS